jgi:hypothetical protein
MPAMADATWRTHERVWLADPGNQDALHHAIAARRRAGLPVPGRMLARQVHGGRAFSSGARLQVFVLLPDGRTQAVGRTPGTVELPPHVSVWVQPATPTGPRLASLAADPEEADHIEGLALGPDVQDAALAELQRFGALSRLDLAGCARIGRAGLAHVGRVAAIEVLDLWSLTKLDGLAELAPLSRLVELRARRCANLAPGSLAPLAGLSGLTTLALGGCAKLDSSSLAPLAGLGNLMALDLSETAVDDACVEHLLGLRELTLLNLSRTRLTVVGIDRLAALPSLAQLYVAGCAPPTVAAAVELSRAVPRLEVVGA